MCDSNERRNVSSDYTEDIVENLITIQNVYTTKLSCLLPSGPICQYLIQNDKKISWIITSIRVPNRNKITFFCRFVFRPVRLRHKKMLG